MMKVQRECDETAYTFTQMVTEGVQRTVELKLRQEERERAVSELDKARKTTEAANKKLEQKKVLKAQDEADKEAAKLEIVELDQNLEVRALRWLACMHNAHPDAPVPTPARHVIHVLACAPCARMRGCQQSSRSASRLSLGRGAEGEG